MSSHEPDGDSQKPTSQDLATPTSADVPPGAPTWEPHHACKQCHSVWPESWMVRGGKEWLCKPCAPDAAALARQQIEEQRALLRARKRRKLLVIFLVIALLVVLGKFSLPYLQSIAPVAGESSQPWASKPPAQWPQFVLSNKVSLAPDATVEGRSAFLLIRADGKIFGIAPGEPFSSRMDAARNLSAGTETIGQLQKGLEQWIMHEPGKPAAGLVFTKLYGPAERLYATTAIAFENTDGKKVLPSTPLKVRKAAVTPGTQLSVVLPKSDGKPPGQSVFPGKAALSAGDMYMLALDAPAPAVDLAGAPVLDANGNLAGMAAKPYGTPTAEGLYSMVVVISAPVLESAVK